MISVIIGIRNRALLFERSLRSWAAQTAGKDAFELVVVDQNSADELRPLLDGYSNSLNIRYFNIDPADGNVPPPPELKNWTNPAFPQNFGVKNCSGDIIVLTSPETIQANTNISRIDNRMSKCQWAFLYGRVINSTIQPVDFQYESLASVRGEIYCGKERPPHREPLAYFIGAMWKKDFIKIGGIEEMFMQGVAKEDREFGRRCAAAGISLMLDETIIGIHQAHESALPRPGTTSAAVKRNEYIYNHLNAMRTIGNQDRPWGEMKKK